MTESIEQEGVNERIREGVVTATDLSSDVDGILDAVESGRALLVSRQVELGGKIVGVIIPTTMREMVERLMQVDLGMQASMTAAENAIAEGRTFPASEVLQEEDSPAPES